MSQRDEMQESRLMNTMRILWGAILTSTVMFLVVLFVIKGTPPNTPVNPLFAIVFAVVAVGAAAASFALPAIVLRMQLSKLSFPKQERAMFGMQDEVALPSELRVSALRAYQTSLILSLALSEPIALFGFVLGFLQFPASYYMPFFVAGWILIAVRFPRIEVPLRALADVKAVRGSS